MLRCGVGRRVIMAGSLRAGESLLRRSHDADRRIHASMLMVSGCRMPGNHESPQPLRSRCAESPWDCPGEERVAGRPNPRGVAGLESPPQDNRSASVRMARPDTRIASTPIRAQPKRPVRCANNRDAVARISVSARPDWIKGKASSCSAKPNGSANPAGPTHKDHRGQGLDSGWWERGPPCPLRWVWIASKPFPWAAERLVSEVPLDTQPKTPLEWAQQQCGGSAGLCVRPLGSDRKQTVRMGT
jgi:hypothetical protein